MSAAIALQILRCLAPPKPELPTTGGVVSDERLEPAEQSAIAPNQHLAAISASSTKSALLAALDHWEKGGCDCCSPTVLDDALEAIGYDEAFWERMRRFALQLANTAQNVIDMEAEERHVHAWGEWQNDPAGAVRECPCGAVDFRPEG